MNSLNHPKISVVIPSFNQGQYIEQTLTSILYQNYPNLEVIVMDGGSTDNTLEVINKYSNLISHFVSEPDNGQAHAINKGFRQATGDILAWLNSDDMYLPCALSKIASLFTEITQPKLIYGGCLHFTEDTDYTHGFMPGAFDATKLTYLDYIVQPSTFWTKALWEKVGELNESYHYVLDWEWFIRASKICEFTPVNQNLSIYRIHDAHKSSFGGAKRSEEIVSIIETYAPSNWHSIYRDTYKYKDSIIACQNKLSKFKLYRLRQLLYPQLFIKYGAERVDVAMTML